jgi:hypothetical protein
MGSFRLESTVYSEQDDEHILRTLDLGENMGAKYAAALADRHEHRDSSRLLRFRTQIVYNYTHKVIVEQSRGRQRNWLTPCDDNTDGGVGTACDAKHGEIADANVIMDRE